MVIGESFYFCVACKDENSVQMQEIFNKYFPHQTILQTTIYVTGEIGFLFWMVKNGQSREILEGIFTTICDEQIFGNDKVPESIHQEFKAKLDHHLG